MNYLRAAEDRERLPVFQMVHEPNRSIRDQNGKWRTISGPEDPDYERASYIKDPRWFYYYNMHYELSRLMEPNLSMSPYKAFLLEIQNCTDEACHPPYLGPLSVRLAEPRSDGVKRQEDKATVASACLEAIPDLMNSQEMYSDQSITTYQPSGSRDLLPVLCTPYQVTTPSTNSTETSVVIASAPPEFEASNRALAAYYRKQMSAANPRYEETICGPTSPMMYSKATHSIPTTEYQMIPEKLSVDQGMQTREAESNTDE